MFPEGGAGMRSRKWTTSLRSPALAALRAHALLLFFRLFLPLAIFRQRRCAIIKR